MNLETAKESAANHNSSTSRGRRKEASECSNCGTHKAGCGWCPLLHHIRLRGMDRVLCTSCVLRLHPSSFCPLCFHFFDHSVYNSHSTPNNASNRQTIPCSKCSSLTHSHCLPTSHSSSTSSYLCPPCSNPNFSFFDLDETHRSIDKNLASILLCAARIASASMSKAVIVARADAERKVREAALAKKRAREALENLAMVEARDRSRRKKVKNKENGNLVFGTGKEKKKVEVVESMQSNGNEKGRVNLGANGWEGTKIATAAAQL